MHEIEKYMDILFIVGCRESPSSYHCKFWWKIQQIVFVWLWIKK